jgi:hypothetical protein
MNTNLYSRFFGTPWPFPQLLGKIYIRDFSTLKFLLILAVDAYTSLSLSRGFILYFCEFYKLIKITKSVLLSLFVLNQITLRFEQYNNFVILTENYIFRNQLQKRS